jgi:DNA-binding NarL/FixJ family response regulator
MIQHLRATLPQTPVLLLTGVYIDPKVVRETLGGKIGAYLQKTTPLATILEEVRNLIGK